MQPERNVLDESLDNESKSRSAMTKSGTLEACGADPAGGSVHHSGGFGRDLAGRVSYRFYHSPRQGECLSSRDVHCGYMWEARAFL
jgi:hypothetical protein